MTPSVLAFVGIGFLVGFRHAFEPDHLAAVSTLATHHRGWRSAAGLGVAWGVGHTAAVGVVALVIGLLGVHVPERFYHGAELGVAALLVLLGVRTLWTEARRHAAQFGAQHAAWHVHHHPHAHPVSLRTVRSALGFGVAHGLAGSGAVMVLIVAAASTGAAQLAYLGAFGAGTVLGMSVVSFLTGAVSAVAQARSGRMATGIRIAAAGVSAATGLWLGWGVLMG